MGLLAPTPVYLSILHNVTTAAVSEHSLDYVFPLLKRQSEASPCNQNEIQNPYHGLQNPFTWSLLTPSPTLSLDPRSQLHGPPVCP